MVLAQLVQQCGGRPVGAQAVGKQIGDAHGGIIDRLGAIDSHVGRHGIQVCDYPQETLTLKACDAILAELVRQHAADALWRLSGPGWRYAPARQRRRHARQVRCSRLLKPGAGRLGGDIRLRRGNLSFRFGA